MNSIDVYGGGVRRIDASPERLMEQAGWTAETYLGNAVECIDKQFGEGFAKKHPELIGCFMLTAALDFHAAAVQIAGQNIQEGLTDASQTIKDGLTHDMHRTDHPLFGETLSDGVSGIADALSEISTSLDHLIEVPQKLQNIATVLDANSCGRSS
jgi:hypothetical protein